MLSVLYMQTLCTVPTLNIFALWTCLASYLRLVADILHCVSAVMTVVIAVLQKYLFNQLNMFKVGTVVHWHVICGCAG